MYTVNITLPAEQDLNAAVEYYCTVLKPSTASYPLPQSCSAEPEAEDSNR